MNRRSNLPFTNIDINGGSDSSAHRSPRGSMSAGNNVASFSSLRQLNNFKMMVKRLLRPSTLDFETAIWEIINLLINPRKIYRTQYYYKQYQLSNGTSSFARDDPSFLILLTIFLLASAVAWGITYSPHLIDIFKFVIYMVLVDFYLVGMIISTIFWVSTNLLINWSNTATSAFNPYNMSFIEWNFCFDIHCNSFLIIWFLLYFVQFLLLPLLAVKGSTIALIVGNSLYFGAISYYFIVTLYGYNSLPLLDQNRNSSTNILRLVLTMGILPSLAIFWFISIIIRYNVAYNMLYEHLK